MPIGGLAMASSEYSVAVFDLYTFTVNVMVVCSLNYLLSQM